jgi:hypothetical protein
LTFNILKKTYFAAKKEQHMFCKFKIRRLAIWNEKLVNKLEEKLPAADRLLGVQFWLNLPAKDKIAPPAYHNIKNLEIEEIDFDCGKSRLLAG